MPTGPDQPRPDPARLVGECRVFYAYDIAASIDIARADQLLAVAGLRAGSGGRAPGRFAGAHRRRPSYFGYQPAPLRLTDTDQPVPVDAWRADAAAELVAYDFGAVSVNYTIPIDDPPDRLVGLAAVLWDHPGLRADADRRVRELTETIGLSLTRPGPCDIIEDYAVYRVRPPEPAGRLVDHHAPALAAMLRAETGPMADQAVRDALDGRVSLTPHDLLIVDWNAALMLGDDDESARAVLEFTNLSLTELRVVDRQLDALLDRGYRYLSRDRRPVWPSWPDARALRRLAQLQVDAALLFETVHSSLKLVGDEGLARLHRVAADRLRLPEWEHTIRGKLGAADGVYQKLADYQASRRIEVLEWIIIALIAFEIVFAFIGR